MPIMNAGPEPVEWRKARRSMGNGNCLEIAAAGRGVLVRDSKDRMGPVLSYTAESWLTFTREARLGHYDTRNP
jgi:hypothetical protein